MCMGFNARAKVLRAHALSVSAFYSDRVFFESTSI